MLQRASRRLILAVVLFTVGVSAAFAQAEKVYVTRTGEKYHRASCTSLRSSRDRDAARGGSRPLCAMQDLPATGSRACIAGTITLWLFASRSCARRTASIVSHVQRP